METKGFYDRYKSVFYQFGAEKVITLAFCELFTANCLEVRKSEVTGELTHQYRFKGSAPTSFLHKVERIVAERLIEFNTFPAMLAAAKADAKKFYKIGPANVMERLLSKGKNDPINANPNFRKILEEALQQNALNYDVQPGGC
jgi:hypothetical protein